MHEMLYLVVAWALGLVVCVVTARAIIVRYRLPWLATLMYFGLVPYPEEVVLPRHPQARRGHRLRGGHVAVSRLVGRR